MERYKSANALMRERFSCKVYKLAIDGGFTCPNRDGTCGDRGCIFCSGGSGDFAVNGETDLNRALEEAKLLVADKNPSGKYMAYFQSFTGTYAPYEKLEKLYRTAIENPEIVALDIATRPDCLPPRTLRLLSELNQIKPVWVELGLQTIHPATAEYIRRGYDLPVFDRAVKDLQTEGLMTIVHMILGLPGETPEMMIQTAEYIADSGAEGIKLQLLHVLRNTDLEADYEAGLFHTLSLEEYITLLEDCIRRLPPEMTVHRLTGDGAKRNLIAPLWSADKKRVLNQIRAAFERDNLIQGELYEKTGDRV